MSKWAKATAGAISKIGSGRLTWSFSRVAPEMNVDPPPSQELASSSAPRPCVLTNPSELRLKTEHERDFYKKLKGKPFAHTQALDFQLL